MRFLIVTALAFVTILEPTSLIAAPQAQEQMKEVGRILRQASDLLGSISERDRQGLEVGIVAERARSGDLDGALAEAQLLQRPEAKKQALGCIANAMDYSGNLSGALSLIGTLDESQRGSLYATLSGFHATRGDLEGALRISSLIQRDPTDLVHSLLQIAKEQSKSGDQASAKSTLGRAFGIAENALKEDPNIPTLFMAIALAQSEIGEATGAETSLSHYADIVHHTKDPVWKANFLPTIATALAEIGDIDGALRAVEELPPGSGRDAPLMLIAGELAHRGNLSDAFKSVSRISEAQTKTAGFQRIADVQARSGDGVAALETISMIPDLGRRAAALSALALAQAEKGDTAAGNTVHLAWETVGKSASKVPDHVFDFIAVTRAILGDNTGAREALNRLAPDARAWPLSTITSFMAESGHADEALLFAANEDSPLSKANALLGAARGLLNRVRTKAKEDSAQH